MNNTICILDGDSRQLYLANYIKNKGYHLVSKENIDSATILVGACPLIKHLSKNVLIEILDTNPKIKSFIGCGITNDYLSICKSKYVTTFDLMNYEAFKKTNSYLTAEGLLASIISTYEAMIPDTKFLVLGFGSCGNEICNLLYRLNGDITVFDRKSEKKTSVVGLRYNFTSNINDIALSDYDIIINTIPFNYLEANHIEIPYNVYFYDIASSPYGISLSLSLELSHYYLLPSLPGKYSPLTSGYLMGKALEEVLDIIAKSE